MVKTYELLSLRSKNSKGGHFDDIRPVKRGFAVSVVQGTWLAVLIEFTIHSGGVCKKRSSTVVSLSDTIPCGSLYRNMCWGWFDKTAIDLFSSPSTEATRADGHGVKLNLCASPAFSEDIQSSSIPYVSSCPFLFSCSSDAKASTEHVCAVVNYVTGHLLEGGDRVVRLWEESNECLRSSLFSFHVHETKRQHRLGSAIYMCITTIWFGHKSYQK